MRQQLLAGRVKGQGTTGFVARPSSLHMKIEGARRSDLAGIRWLLEYEHLPSDDLTETLLDHFLVYRDEKGVAGVVGVEIFEKLALLRSLAVASDGRRSGLGGRLVLAAEALCRRLGVQSIYLLTTTAEGFFAARGYRSIARADAPVEILGTTQFSQLCPSSATLMVKP